MDYASIVIILSFIAYGVFEYQRRDREYRIMIRQIAAGLPPIPPSEQPALWKLMTLGGTGFLVLLVVGWIVAGIVRRHTLVYAIPMALLGSLFLVILVFLVLMFVRDLRAFRRLSKSR